MAKYTDAIRDVIIAAFNAGDQPTEAQFTNWITRVQEGIDEHDHTGIANGDGIADIGALDSVTMADGAWLGIGVALERFVFNAAGNIRVVGGDFGVGIVPTRRLHVATATDEVLLVESTDATAIIELIDNATVNPTLVRRVTDVTDIYSNAVIHLTLDGTGEVAIANGPAVLRTLVTPAGAALTLDAAGAITVTHSFHVLETFGLAATDDLVTINGAAESGHILVIRSTNNARDIVVKNTGNIVLNAAGDFTLTTINDRIMLQFYGANWYELSRSDNV